MKIAMESGFMNENMSLQHEMKVKDFWKDLFFLGLETTKRSSLRVTVLSCVSNGYG